MNSFFDQCKFKAVQSLSCRRTLYCGKHEFRAQFTEYLNFLGLSLLSKVLRTSRERNPHTSIWLSQQEWRICGEVKLLPRHPHNDAPINLPIPVAVHT